MGRLSPPVRRDADFVTIRGDTSRNGGHRDRSRRSSGRCTPGYQPPAVWPRACCDPLALGRVISTSMPPTAHCRHAPGSLPWYWRGTAAAGRSPRCTTPDRRAARLRHQYVGSTAFPRSADARPFPPVLVLLALDAFGRQRPRAAARAPANRPTPGSRRSMWRCTTPRPTFRRRRTRTRRPWPPAFSLPPSATAARPAGR